MSRRPHERSGRNELAGLGRIGRATLDETVRRTPSWEPEKTMASAVSAALPPSRHDPTEDEGRRLHVVDRGQRRDLGGSRPSAGLLDGGPELAVRLGVAIGSGQRPDGTGGQRQDDPEGDGDGDRQGGVRLRAGSEPPSQAVQDSDHSRSEAQARPAERAWQHQARRERPPPHRRRRAPCSLPPAVAIRVVLAEDNFLVREGVARLLASVDRHRGRRRLRSTTTPC